MIPQDRSTTAIELETVLDDLLPLLRTIQPAKLNATLNALATALEGRGERLGENLELVDGYFTRLNPQLPAIKEDISGLADVTRIYADAAPDLVRMLRNFSVTTNTIRAKADAYAGFLAGTAGFATTTRQLLEENEDRIIQLAAVGRPILGVLAEYSPEYPCLLQGLAQSNDFIGDTFANGELHITLEVTKARKGVPAGRGARLGREPRPALLRAAEPAPALAGEQVPGRHQERRQRRSRARLPGRPAERAVRERRGAAGRRRAACPADGRPGGTGPGPRDAALRPDGPRDGGGAVVKTGPSLVKLIVFIVVTVIATGTLAATIGNLRFGGTTSYRALFSDATGLLKGDDVRIAGVRVGEIDSVAVTERAGRSLAQVTFTVDSDRAVAVSTKAQIRYRNLVGQRYVALTEGAGSGRRLTENGMIPLRQTRPALDLTVLFNGFKPLFAALSPNDVNSFAMEIIKTLQGEAGNVNSLLGHTASLTSTLADRDAVIGRTIDNLNTVLGTVDERDEQLSTLITELQRFVSGLSEDRAAIGASLTNIANLADATAGLVKESRPAIRTDVKKLGEVAGTLDDNKKVVAGVLQRLPDKLNTITRTATYGSWFNFYLCDFTGRVILSNVITYTPNYHSAAARCR